MSILRPDLIDHEDIEEFTLTLEAYDLVRDIEKRRIVMLLYCVCLSCPGHCAVDCECC